MGTSFRLAWAAGAAALLFGCETYPYASGFSVCDDRAGQCYRACEAYAGGPGYSACHADCDYEADQCFASAYGPYYSAYPSYAYLDPWYGRYGVWYPQRGYVFSLNVYNRYPHRHPAHPRNYTPRYEHYWRDRDHDRADHDRSYRGQPPRGGALTGGRPGHDDGGRRPPPVSGGQPHPRTVAPAPRSGAQPKAVPAEKRTAPGRKDEALERPNPRSDRRFQQPR
ncbi:MAG: hypothetical protein GC153_02115 [Alphaproteobacteria bacterium]|nr:hypothetical protein [Alphaproteobacteria bacterium]